MLNRLNQDYADVLWRLCVDKSPEFIVIVGCDGAVQYANHSVERAGFDVDEELPFLVGSKEVVNTVFKTGQSCELMVPAMGVGGETGWYMSRMEPVVVGDGVDAVVVMAEDITEAKFVRDLSTCRREVLESIFEGAALPDVLSSLAKSIEGVLSGMKCSVLLVSKDKKTLRSGAAPSLPDFYNEAIDGIPIGPDVGCCGTAAYSRCRVVVANTLTDKKWRQFKHLAAEAKLVACWSEPVIGSDGEVLGTFALYYDKPREPSERESQFIDSAAQLTAIAIERHKSAEQKRLFMNELNHRVKNMLASVISLTRLTMDASVDLKQFEEVFLGRLNTMAQAHEALALSQWQEMNLEEALDRVMIPFTCATSTQIKSHGPSLSLPSKKVLPLCLVMHELGTNSIKYGALSSSSGLVDLSWTHDDDNQSVCLVWSESGGPAVSKPKEKGLGTWLIEGLVDFELKGEVCFDYAEKGLDCRMSISLAG